MTAQRSVSWVRHLRIAGILFVAATLVIVLWHIQTFWLMFENMGALSEGREWVESLQSPDDVLAYLQAHPEQGALVAYDVGDATNGLFWQADEGRATVGLAKLHLLDVYAQRVASGTLDPAEHVAWADWERFYLPGADQGHFEHQRQQWEGGSSTLAERVQSAFRTVDPISQDYILYRLAKDTSRNTWVPLSDSLALPLPMNGVFLSWQNHTLEALAADRLASYAGMHPSTYRTLVYDLANEYASNTAFRRQEREHRTEGFAAIRLKDQRDLARHTFPKATAAAFAQYAIQVAQSGQAEVRDSWFTPIGDGEHQSLFSTWGTVAGSFPGTISFVGYAERTDQPPRVVVLLLQNLPLAVYYHLTQQSFDKAVPLFLLADDAFFDRARLLMGTPAAQD